MTHGGPANATPLLRALPLPERASSYFKMGYASALAWMLFLIILVFTLIQWSARRRYWVYYEGEARAE